MIICWKYENFNPVEFTIKTQLRLKFFFQLCVKLTESDNKLRDSERGRLKTDRDRNGQINGSDEEISSVYENILRKNIRS